MSPQVLQGRCVQCGLCSSRRERELQEESRAAVRCAGAARWLGQQPCGCGTLSVSGSDKRHRGKSRGCSAAAAVTPLETTQVLVLRLRSGVGLN